MLERPMSDDDRWTEKLGRPHESPRDRENVSGRAAKFGLRRDIARAHLYWPRAMLDAVGNRLNGEAEPCERGRTRFVSVRDCCPSIGSRSTVMQAPRSVLRVDFERAQACFKTNERRKHAGRGGRAPAAGPQQRTREDRPRPCQRNDVVRARSMRVEVRRHGAPARIHRSRAPCEGETDRRMTQRLSFQASDERSRCTCAYRLHGHSRTRWSFVRSPHADARSSRVGRSTTRADARSVIARECLSIRCRRQTCAQVSSRSTQGSCDCARRCPTHAVAPWLCAA